MYSKIKSAPEKIYSLRGAKYILSLIPAEPNEFNCFLETDTDFSHME